MSIQIQPISFSSAVEQLLAVNHLPTADLHGTAPIIFCGHYTAQTLTGIIGLEVCRPYMLLRSLAVAETQRTQGIGAALVAYAEAHAAQAGAQALYLLTTTADQFFARHGYCYVDRAAVPAAIAATQEFADLCPASSQVMMKSLTR